MSKRLTSVVSAVLLLLLAVLPYSSASTEQTDPSVVAVSFTFFGCNRIDGPDWDANRLANPSSANVPQLRQNLADVAALAPDYQFFGGDLVMGYADDNGERLRSQMSAWIKLVGTMPRSSRTQYVAISGNHEMNRKVGEQKLPSPAMDGVWSDLVRKAGFVPRGARGPSPETSPADNLVSDQGALSYSFNRGPVHFVVLDTDTRAATLDAKTGETKIAMVPAHWLDADLDAAEKNRRITSVIIMGHRNVVEPALVHGDAPIDPECATMVLHSLESHKKVRAYICAHVHAFDITAIGSSGLRQVVFGNGGSKLEESWNPSGGRTFGFGYFNVYRDGSLGVIPYLRPAPTNYLDDSATAVPPARAEPELVIRPR